MNLSSCVTIKLIFCRIFERYMTLATMSSAMISVITAKVGGATVTFLTQVDMSGKTVMGWSIGWMTTLFSLEWQWGLWPGAWAPTHSSRPFQDVQSSFAEVKYMVVPQPVTVIYPAEAFCAGLDRYFWMVRHFERKNNKARRLDPYRNRTQIVYSQGANNNSYFASTWWHLESARRCIILIESSWHERKEIFLTDVFKSYDTLQV